MLIFQSSSVCHVFSINQAVEKLLKSTEKVDVNERSSEGFAPLCIAAFWGYAEIVKLLLENG